MKTRVGIIFWHRTDKVNKQGVAPLSCRLTLGGKTAEITTGIRVAPGEWNGARRKVLGKTEAANRANSYLLQMQNQLENIVADLDRQERVVTAQKVATLYRKPLVGGQTLLQVYEAFVAERKDLLGVELAAATIKVNRMCCKQLRQYLAATKQAHLLPEEVSYTFADKLLLFLMQKQGLNRNSANKHLRNLRQLLRWAVRRDYLDKDPLALYKLRAPAQKAIKFLGRGEVDSLSQLVVASPMQAQVRDCFILQCWTGLAYADLAALNVAASTEYATDKAGNVRRVLHITRAKSTAFNGYRCTIPLLPEAERILALYGDAMPVPSNQHYNRALKELGQLCGIGVEKMTTHTGRRTAGTLFLNMGVDLPVVSRILGHANVLITQKLYAELLDTTVLDAFAGFGALGAAATPYQLAA